MEVTNCLGEQDVAQDSMRRVLSETLNLTRGLAQVSNGLVVALGEITAGFLMEMKGKEKRLLFSHLF